MPLLLPHGARYFAPVGLRGRFQERHEDKNEPHNNAGPARMMSRLWNEQVHNETAKRGESLFVRFGSQYLIDVAAWTVALILAVLFRFDFAEYRVTWSPLLLLCLAAALLQLAFGWIFWLYRGRHSYGSFEEARALLFTVVVTAAIAAVLVLAFGLVIEIPRSTVLIAFPLAFVLMGGVRYIRRLYVDRAVKPRNDAQRVLIYGAGHLGAVLVRRMLTDNRSTFLPVGLIDDDKAKRNRQLMGIPV
ncbi:MAG: hypothetical protein H7288_10105, partial [Kineosporiaceae bacterium]|nr:hypothetical protein [Aeromicrobium sp.]